MKKQLRIIAAVCFAAVAVGCSVENAADNMPADMMQDFELTISANMPTTRTAIGELSGDRYPFVWEQNDELAVVENVDGTYSQTVKAVVKELDDDGSSAVFGATLGRRSGSLFDYRAYYPYSAYSGGRLTMPSMQMARAASADPSAILLFASSAHGRQYEELDFFFGHISAYAKMTISGLNIADGSKVKEVHFTVKDKTVAGEFDYSDSKCSSVEGVSEIRVDVSSLDFDGKSDFDVWFASLPVENIAEFTVEAVTALNIYSKSFKVESAREFSLEQGTVSGFKVNMGGADVSSRATLSNEIHYISSNGAIVAPNSSHYADGITFGDGVHIISNTYEDGEGIIVCDNPVTSIGVKAFYECPTLVNITIPETVTEIRDYAFSNDARLKEIVIPDAVTKIDQYAFSYCSALSYVNIGDGVTNIGNYAFYSCSALPRVDMGSGVTRIGDNAFGSCKVLNYINFPERLETIGDEAFSGCYEFADELRFPASLKTIGESAFYACKKFTELVIPENIESVGASAFKNCTGLKTLTINGRAIGSQTFYQCENLESVTIGSKVLNIAGGVFSYTAVKSIVVPDNVQSFGGMSNCPNLESVIIGDGVEEVTTYFINCPKLKTVKLGNNMKNITEYGFLQNCQSITEFTFPDSIVSLVDDSPYSWVGILYQLDNLRTVTYGRGLKTESRAIASCPSLTTIYCRMQAPIKFSRTLIPKTVTAIYVPRESLELYKASWTDVADIIYGHNFD